MNAESQGADNGPKCWERSRLKEVFALRREARSNIRLWSGKAQAIAARELVKIDRMLRREIEAGARHHR